MPEDGIFLQTCNVVEGSCGARDGDHYRSPSLQESEASKEPFLLSPSIPVTETPLVPSPLTYSLGRLAQFSYVTLWVIGRGFSSSVPSGALFVGTMKEHESVNIGLTQHREGTPWNLSR